MTAYGKRMFPLGHVFDLTNGVICPLSSKSNLPLVAGAVWQQAAVDSNNIASLNEAGPVVAIREQ